MLPQPHTIAQDVSIPPGGGTSMELPQRILEALVAGKDEMIPFAFWFHSQVRRASDNCALVRKAAFMSFDVTYFQNRPFLLSRRLYI
jgi:hypothetical protein